MTVAGRRVPVSVLQWVAVLAAPLAWAGQHIAGIALTLAQCGNGGRTWHVPVHGVTIAVTAVAAAVAVVGLVSAVLTKREIDRREGSDEAPPEGRIRFLAVCAIAVSPLLLCIILMSGFGVVFHQTCRQS